VSARLDDAAPSEAAPTRIEVGLGRRAVERLNGATKIVVARLGVDSAWTRRDPDIFADPLRIAGQPIDSDVRTLGAEQASSLKKLLTNDADYLDVRRRCKANTWVGARFGEANSQGRIELVLSLPCDQLIFYRFDSGATESWGSVVAAHMSAKIVKLVSGI